ncbi:MAG: HAMP domain-containing sensor histidine kinase, partial [Pseudomonadota bacterium]
MTAKPHPARGSLHRRLALGGLAGAALILGTGALLLALVFERALERRFDQDLSIVVDNLIASIARMPDPPATEALDLRDERFARAFSGWYWQVIVFEGAAEQQTALSPSLFGESLIGQADGPPPRGWVYAKSEGPGGRPLRIVQRTVGLGGEGRVLTLAAGGDASELIADIARFRLLTLGAVLVLSAAMTGLVLGMVRAGLHPVRRLESGLRTIRQGKGQTLPVDVPRELAPLSEEVNALLAQQASQLATSRRQADSLAHGLKTPLAVLQNEAASLGEPSQALVLAQTSLMRSRIDRHLAVARVAGPRAHPPLLRLRPVLEGIVDVLAKLPASEGKSIELEIEGEPRLAIDPEDFEEIAGNLIENAVKWAETRVIVRASETESGLEFAVGDDGPGMPEEIRRQATERGFRGDETRPGTGIGLTLVAELVEAYGASLALGDACWH